MATSFTLGGMNVPLSNPTIDTQKKIKIYTLDANSNSEIVNKKKKGPALKFQT